MENEQPQASPQKETSATATAEQPAKPQLEIRSTAGEVIASIDSETVTGFDFYRMDLPKADFRDMDLSGCRFYGANLEGADFTNASLHRADFMVANLTNASLRGTNLAMANFLDTNLRGADLTDADWKWAYFKAAKYDKGTKFPKGFDPNSPRVELVKAD